MVRLLIQRVKSASVTVNQETVGRIGPGLLCLLGISKEDTDIAVIKKQAEKLLKLRVWDEIIEAPKEEITEEKPKPARKWHTNVIQRDYEILVVSQFTLYSVMNGNKPDFHKAKEPVGAEEFYDKFVAKLKADYGPSKIATGTFGAYMNVESVNDGPVTISWDSDLK
jgi:D-tyrosyl-tRNA(Tyr) deacylase